MLVSRLQRRRRLELRRPAGEAADDRAVDHVRDDRRQRRLAPVVQQHESRRLEERCRAGGVEAGAHPRVHGGEEDVHEGAAGEERVEQAKGGAERDPAAIDNGEDRGVAEREQDAEDEVERVPGDLRADAVLGDGGAEQERKVDACQAELARRPQRRRQHDRPEHAADDRAPDHAAAASSIATAALISARWDRPCGKFPRKSPLAGSTSSAYSPTSFASATSSSMSAVAPARRPWRAYASASQNEQARKAPSSPGR